MRRYQRELLDLLTKPTTLALIVLILLLAVVVLL
jgi:hypothetical protein